MSDPLAIRALVITRHLPLVSFQKIFEKDVALNQIKFSTVRYMAREGRSICGLNKTHPLKRIRTQNRPK